MLTRRFLLAAAAAACATEPPMPQYTVFELRNYTTAPGQRDVLIDLFEREFVESQDAVGAFVVGTFRNFNDPDRFVWMRAFADMDARHAALETFYSSALWQAHRNAANATIVDSDNVLLLKPVGGNVIRESAQRPPAGAPIPESVIVVATYFLAPNTEMTFAAFYADEVAPVLRDSGAEVVAAFVSEHRANTYPRLPVRENDNVFVAVSRFASADAYQTHLVALRALPARASAERGLAERTTAPAEALVLQPTARSLLR